MFLHVYSTKLELDEWWLISACGINLLTQFVYKNIHSRAHGCLSGELNSFTMFC